MTFFLIKLLGLLAISALVSVLLFFEFSKTEAWIIYVSIAITAWPVISSFFISRIPYIRISRTKGLLIRSDFLFPNYKAFSLRKVKGLMRFGERIMLCYYDGTCSKEISLEELGIVDALTLVSFLEDAISAED